MNSLTLQSRLSKLIADAFDAEGMKVDGLSVRPGDDGGFRISLRMEPTKASPQIDARNKAMALALGLPEDFVGKTLRVNRKLLKVTGFNPGAPKNAVNMRCIDTDKAYKCSASYAKTCIVIG